MDDGANQTLNIKTFKDDEDQIGILERNDIGLLLLDSEDSQPDPGSRIKTPFLPIWVTQINNQWGILFNLSLIHI